ncbi:MAG: hypothetical protein Q8P95_00615, partial [bacterium]|nr:hypothetical protein [bacterium]
VFIVFVKCTSDEGYKFVYRIRDWEYNQSLKITGLDVDTSGAHLVGTFVDCTNIGLRIEGEINDPKGKERYIDELHVSERFFTDDQSEERLEILITPLVNSWHHFRKSDSNNFLIVKPLKVCSHVPGKNKFRLKSGQFYKDFELIRAP